MLKALNLNILRIKCCVIKCEKNPSKKTFVYEEYLRKRKAYYFNKYFIINFILLIVGMFVGALNTDRLAIDNLRLLPSSTYGCRHDGQGNS